MKRGPDRDRTTTAAQMTTAGGGGIVITVVLVLDDAIRRLLGVGLHGDAEILQSAPDAVRDD